MSDTLRFRRSTAVVLPLLLIAAHGTVMAAGEPAEDFLKRLRAARYFDIAILYLDRLDEYPGVNPDLRNAAALEKAQTYIDAAAATRNPKTRDGYFVQAEKELNTFLEQSAHPRVSEARLQLGKLQMVRGAQLMNGQPDDSQRAEARQSYLAAAKTFHAIVEDLRGTLKEMQGANVNASEEPDRAALRKQYQGEFLQGMINAGESRKLAAQTFRDAAKDGKELLEQALVEFTELSEKYDTYVPGAMAMLYRGQVQEALGMKPEALDSYMRMMEQPEADALRDGKYLATSGMIRLWLAEEPPKFASAVERGQGLMDDVRPDEKRTTSVQELRLELAKAYLAKSKDTANQKPGETKRAETTGRQLLIAASKIPGPQMEQAKGMLVELGIGDDEVAELPTAEDPESLADALDKARELWEVSENIAQSLAVLSDQAAGNAEIEKQKSELAKQLVETRSIAIQILRRGLAMAPPDASLEVLNQTRQFLAYLLYDNRNYRDAAVVGTFLAQYAPGSEIGLRGGTLALNSYQLLLSEVPAGDSGALITRLERLGDYLTKTWPGDPQAAAAQGVRVRIALTQDRWDDARNLVEQMPAGSERASFERLMGQLHWNESIKARGDQAKVDQQLADSQAFLQRGLDGIPLELVDPEAARAALILVKVYLKQGKVAKAIEILEHPKYGPKTVMSGQGPPDENFASDLYSSELQAVVQLMTTDDGDPKAQLQRAIEVMDKLRESVAGPDAQKRLTGIYLRMARDIRDQLDKADEAKKAKLIEAFRVFLDRIASSSEDAATLQWVGQTLRELGEASMKPGEVKANGQAAALLTSAVTTFKGLQEKSQDQPLTVNYQLGRAYRLLGQYSDAIKTLEKVLIEKPMMLDAQIEAAQAYESWAGVVVPKFQGNAYSKALNGAKPGEDKKNTIWGWGRISQLTSRNPQFKAMFFDARYHVALCRYKWGMAINDDLVKQKAVSDITTVNALYPDLGGDSQRKKFDALLRTIQKDLGKPVQGLPKLEAKK